MLPTEDLFVYVYVLIDDLITAGTIAIPPRPGPAPGCSDAELLAIALVRHLLGRRSEAGFLAEVARDWSHLRLRAAGPLRSAARNCSNAAHSQRVRRLALVWCGSRGNIEGSHERSTAEPVVTVSPSV
jgi:hypothetical protein